jgi:hypothetical protein
MNLSIVSAIVALLCWTGTASAAPVTLALKFPAGQVDRMSTTMDMDQTLTADALPAPQKQTIKMGMDMLLKVVKSDDTGATVEMTFDRMSMGMSMFGKEMKFDSEKDKPSADNPLSGLGVLVGVKLTAHFGKDGKVDKVEGVDEMKKKLSTDASNVVAAQVLKQTMNEDQLKQTVNAAFAEAIPSKPVDIGDTWESNVTQNTGGMAIKMKAENKLVAIDEKGGHKIAKIEFTGDGKLEGAPAGAPKLKADQLTQKGTRYFDIDRGAFTEMDTDQTLKGSMTVPTPNGDTAIKLDQTMSAKMTLKPAEAKPADSK